MVIRAPPLKMREPYSNHFSFRPTDFILHIQMEDKERKTPIVFYGVKGQGHSDMTPSGALSDCVSFLVYVEIH